MRARTHCVQRHEILPICAYVDDIVVKGVFITIDAPLQQISRNSGRDRHAVVYAGFHFGSLLIVVPGGQLQRIELVCRVVKAIDFGERL